MMSLALRLGKTLDELTRTLSARELKMWMAFDRISPIGDWRGDVQAAQVTAAVINAQGGKLSLKDALLKWGGENDSGSEELSEPENWLGSL